MTFAQQLSLMWRRFSPLEEQLLAAVRTVLPAEAVPVFDAQVSAITLVQRHPHWVEICFFRRRRGRVDWSDVPAFPHVGEFRLARVQFEVAGRRFKATLTSIQGHIFDFHVTPGPKSIAFAAWDGAPVTRLLTDPTLPGSTREPEPIPPAWSEFLQHQRSLAPEWTLYDFETAFSTAFENGEFLILAEREGEQFVLYRLEPPASGLFYLESHDGDPEPITEDLSVLFQKARRRRD